MSNEPRLLPRVVVEHAESFIQSTYRAFNQTMHEETPMAILLYSNNNNTASVPVLLQGLIVRRGVSGFSTTGVKFWQPSWRHFTADRYIYMINIDSSTAVVAGKTLSQGHKKTAAGNRTGETKQLLRTWQLQAYALQSMIPGTPPTGVLYIYTSIHM